MVFQKKSLGQHFLKDENIAKKIVDEFCKDTGQCASTVEIGPGMGVLTKYLMEREKNFFAIEIDKRCIEFLNEKIPELKERIIHQDILKVDFAKYLSPPTAIIGNFPYNISSQIIFKILENRNQIPLMVGMFQKEVAKRIASKPNSKEYGILSVLVQAFYHVEYLFEVGEGSFSPPPKVKSAVIKLLSKGNENLGCNEKLFFKIVKTAFGQRRKTLRNALKEFLTKKESDQLKEEKIFDKRAEQLSTEQFIELTKKFEP